jgi:formylglycine-generating enzyme
MLAKDPITMRTDDFIVRALVLCAASGCSSSNAGLPADAGGSASSSRDTGSAADSGGSSDSGSGPSGASDSGSTAASCQSGGPGVANCGSSSESCCTSLDVSGGTYDRTYTNTGDGGTDEADPATVSGFRFDKYLVTVGRFRQYVTYLSGSTGAPPANGSGIHTHLNGGLGLADGASPGSYETGWDAASWNAYIATGTSAPSTWNAALTCDTTGLNSWTNTPGTQENLPIVCTTWWEAYAFCIWDGGFLPSEAEWEYAAAGGSQEREYPWGSTDPGMMNEYAIFGCNYPTGVAKGTCTSVANIAPVGIATLGAGLWGQLDLVGDVFEWNLDWSGTFTDPCTNCAILTGGTTRVIAGGSFSYDDSYLPPSNPYLSPPALRSGNTGFRCARTP